MAVKCKSGHYAVDHVGYMAYQVIDVRDNQVYGNFRNLSESFGYAMQLNKLEKQEENNEKLYR